MVTDPNVSITIIGEHYKGHQLIFLVPDVTWYNLMTSIHSSILPTIHSYSYTWQYGTIFNTL